MPVPFPLEEIVEDFKEGMIIPFLGAGASAGLRPNGPDGKPLPWSDGTQDFPPTGAELASYLADRASLPAEARKYATDLARISSYYEYAALGRPTLKRRLRDIFCRAYRPGPLHHLLARVARDHRPLLVVTTNYDTLVEQAFDAAQAPYHLVVHQNDNKDALGQVLVRPAGAAAFESRPTKRTGIVCAPDQPSVVYKMHGSIVSATDFRQNQFVITEEDYVDFLQRMTNESPIPAELLLPLSERRLLFLGYGLSDWNLRLLLSKLGAIDGLAPGGYGRPTIHWAIQRDTNAVDESTWSYRGVNIRPIALDDFVAELAGAGL